MTPFPPNKNATKLGIDLTRKFVVVNKANGFFPIGTIIKILRDDGTLYPWFYEEGENERETHATYWSNIAYYDESKHSDIGMSKALEVYRRFKLNPSDKIMEDLGLENPATVPTEDGIKFMIEILWQKFREDTIIPEAQKVWDEENKKKE